MSDMEQPDHAQPVAETSDIEQMESAEQGNDLTAEQLDPTGLGGPRDVPNDADGYELPDGWREEGGNAIRELAHDLGLDREQFSRLLEKGQQSARKAEESIQVEIENQIAEATASLRTKWGRNFAANGRLAERALTRFASPELVSDLKAGGWTREPGFIEFLHAVGERLGEDRIDAGRGNVGGGNPWNPSQPNLTEQGRLMRENPGLARSLAAQAGISLS